MTSGGAPRTRPPAPHWRGPKRGPSIASGWKRPGRRRARCYPRAWPSIRRSPPAGCCYPVPLRRRRMRTAARRPRGPGGRSRSRRGLDGWRTAGSSPLGTTPRRRCCRTRRAGSTTSPPALRRPSTRYRRATLTWETATSARGTGWWPMVGTGGWRGASSPCSWHSRWRSRRRLRCRPAPGPPRCRGCSTSPRIRTTSWRHVAMSSITRSTAGSSCGRRVTVQWVSRSACRQCSSGSSSGRSSRDARRGWGAHG